MRLQAENPAKLRKKLAQSNSPEACFEGLAEGAYDAVARTLHAVTAKTNPNGAAALAALDDGLRTIKENGERFKIIRRHLTKHRALVN